MSVPGDEVLLGLEVVKLGDVDDDSPWQLTVDAFVDGKIVRYQVTGRYNGWPDGPPERTLEDLARVQIGDSRATAAQIAAELDRLDREHAARVAPLVRELQRAQIIAIHGQSTLDWLDREASRNG